MQGSRTTIGLQRPLEGNDLYARLNWLLVVNEQAERRSKLFRHAAEEQEFLLMRRPLDTLRVFALFGLMMGLFPPAAIFIKIFGYGIGRHNSSALLFIVCLLMNLTCAGMGYVMGGAFSRSIESLERSSWTSMLIRLPLIGAGWGVVTGFAGGLIFIGIGAIFGAIFAIPIGALAFTLFATLHRALLRGGMIDARHFWPLASGATLFTAALVLGL
jgi:hypothetical protein